MHGGAFLTPSPVFASLDVLALARVSCCGILRRMNTATTTRAVKKNRTVSLDMSEVHKLYELSTRIADATEDVLEQESAYSPAFLATLARAKRDVAEGRVKRIDSLRDLM
jgi:hypothetical protein